MGIERCKVRGVNVVGWLVGWLVCWLVGWLVYLFVSYFLSTELVIFSSNLRVYFCKINRNEEECKRSDVQ